MVVVSGIMGCILEYNGDIIGILSGNQTWLGGIFQLAMELITADGSRKTIAPPKS